ncbi:MAG: hypothetical protein J5745_01140 [Bacteroidales bacterium]|nr:hypothetical protein [Bacteroidales bacterium]
MRRAVAIILTLFWALSLSAKDYLAELDGYIRNREAYDQAKEERIEAARIRLRSMTCPDDKYAVCMDLADEFFSYRFDSTQFYLKKAMEYCQGNKAMENKAGIKLGYLYAKSGNYMEAYDRLYLRTDTTALSDQLKADYFFALFEFSRDLSGNSGMVERLSIPDRSIYRKRTMELIPPHSEMWRRLKMDEYKEVGNYAAADSIGHQLYAMVSPQSHNAAIYAYDLSEIAYFENRKEDQMRYLVMSAEADLVNAVKDYASLTIIAQAIIDSDVDRSFRYLRISQEDALIYNAKLRPWQISQFFLTIEQNYENRRNFVTRMTIVAAAVMALLVLLLGAAVRQLSRRTKALRQTQKSLEEASALKEAYIAKFFGYLSEDVANLRTDDHRARKLLKQGRSEELLRTLSESTRAEDALEEFYGIIDKTVLGLYPDFVKQVNSLLRPDCQILPKKDNSLNTELRIVALVRLGIDDSKDIAELLHYSLSTIYNYKVSLKSSASGDRELFWKKVKSIGK